MPHQSMWHYHAVCSCWECPLAAKKGEWLLRESRQPACREPRGEGRGLEGGCGSRSCPAWGVKCREDIPGLDLEIETKACLPECWCQGGKLTLCQRSASWCALPVFSMDCSYVDITCNACASKWHNHRCPDSLKADNKKPKVGGGPISVNLCPFPKISGISSNWLAYNITQPIETNHLHTLGPLSPS